MNYADLGRAAKEEAPGEYDDYTDEALGRDLAEDGWTVEKIRNFKMNDKEAALEKKRRESIARSADDIYRQIQNKSLEFSHDSSWFKSWAAKSSNKRTVLNFAHASELASMLEIAKQLASVKILAEKADVRTLFVNVRARTS